MIHSIWNVDKTALSSYELQKMLHRLEKLSKSDELQYFFYDLHYIFIIHNRTKTLPTFLIVSYSIQLVAKTMNIFFIQ